MIAFLTLLFSLAQAIWCADAGVTLISPFVGGICDLYKKEHGRAQLSPDQDPGVASIIRIYNYYKRSGNTTQVMGARLRNVDQFVRLAGADLLTISPDLLDQLEQTEGELEWQLDPETAKASAGDQFPLDASTFRWIHDEDAMATESLLRASASSTLTPFVSRSTPCPR